MPLIFVSNLIRGLGWAGIAVAGNSTVARLALQGNEGAVMGAYTSVVSIGAIVGAFISGYLVLWIGYAALFLVAGLGIAATILWLWLIRRSAAHLVGANL